MKKRTNKPPSITAAAHTAKRLRADLMALNVALTVEGNDTAAERLAHGHLLPILQALATVQNSIAALHNACQ